MQAMLGEASAQLALVWWASLHTAAISLLPVCQAPSFIVVFKVFVVPSAVQDVGNTTCSVREEKALPKIVGKK